MIILGEYQSEARKKRKKKGQAEKPAEVNDEASEQVSSPNPPFNDLPVVPASNNSSDANLRNNVTVQSEAQRLNSCHESEIAKQKLNDLLKSNKVIQSFLFLFVRYIIY